MNKNLLNISGKISEPIVKVYELITEVAGKNNVRFFVIGATARGMVFEHGYNIPTSRATRDIDLAVQVATWDEFQSLKNALTATGYFADSKMMQRMYYQNQIPIDIVPFGAIENQGSISWPPDDSVKMNVTGLVWSYILQFENDQNPHIAHKHEIAKWKNLSRHLISASDDIIANAKHYQTLGLHVKDALHCACAVKANADIFLTTDKQLINKARAIADLKVINPLRFIEEDM